MFQRRRHRHQLFAASVADDPTYWERGHHSQLIMHHVCEFRMHSCNPPSCFLRDASSLIDADGQVSGATYKQVRILDRFGAQSVHALPLTDTPCISTFQRNWRKIFQLFGHLLNSQGQSVSPDISIVRRNCVFCAKDLKDRT